MWLLDFSGLVCASLAIVAGILDLRLVGRYLSSMAPQMGQTGKGQLYFGRKLVCVHCLSLDINDGIESGGCLA